MANRRTEGHGGGEMIWRTLSVAATGLALAAYCASPVWAGLADDIEQVREVYGIQMTDKPTTFEVRDNGMSNRLMHKGTIARSGALNLFGCGYLKSHDGDPVEFVRYSPSMLAVKNLRTGKQCVAQRGPNPSN